MKIGALISAAGMSKRMNNFKQLMTIGDLTLIEHTILEFRHAGILDIVVITGHRYEEVEKILSPYDVILLHNESYQTSDMFASVKIGLDYFKDKVDRLFFTPGDIPLFSPETVSRLLEKTGDLICPSYHGKSGHPLLIDAKLIPKLLAFNGEGGLSGACKSTGAKLISLETDDPGIIFDADTKDDFSRLEELYYSRIISHCDEPPESQ